MMKTTKGTNLAPALSLARTPRLAGHRFPFRYGLNLDALPRRSFDEGMERLTWEQVRSLLSCLERMGYPGDTTVAELLLKLDGYIRKTDGDDHQARYRRRFDDHMREHRRRMAAQAVEAEGRDHAGRHLVWAKHAGKLPRLAAFYGRLQVGRAIA